MKWLDRLRGGGSGGHADPKPIYLELRGMLLETDPASRLGLNRPLVAVRGIRNIGKKQMIHNDLTPHIEVDPETYEVRADGQLLTCEPAEVLPLAQRYFLF